MVVLQLLSQHSLLHSIWIAKAVCSSYCHALKHDGRDWSAAGMAQCARGG